MIACEIFCEWPYDHALCWMKKQHDRVSLDQNKGYCAVGSHKETVISLGRDTSRGSIDKARLSQWPGLIIRANDRGGGLTAHEPGQLVLYPVLHLQTFNLKARDLIKLLEETTLGFAASLSIKASCNSESPGIFVGDAKVGFIGMRIKEGISTHGLALNVLNDARIFESIEPCGIKNLPVASLCQHAKLEQNIEWYAQKLASCFVAKLEQHRSGIKSRNHPVKDEDRFCQT